MYILNTLAPVFLIIFLGATLQKTGFLNSQLSRQNNRLVYWIAMPCLLFNKTAQAEIAGDSALRVTLVLLFTAVGCTIFAYLLARLLSLSGASTGAFVQASFRGNLAYIGLPVVSYALTELTAHNSAIGSLTEAQIQSLAILSIAPLVPAYNALAVFVLVTGSKKGKQSWLKLLRPILTNPLLLACALGLSWGFLNLPLPLALSKTLQTLGQIALPLALFSIGVSLATTKVTGKVTVPIIATSIKVVVAPIFGLLLANWLGLSNIETAIALLYLACPTAIASYIMAQQLGGDEVLTSNSIVLSTLLSALSLAIVLATF
ncbi:AEC family transporter [Pleurocapsales cyanobacterium LEGE 10410]|nr:AEC family transporter [Pleurocapsales cyanobacterium LEGE 10410]